MYIDVSQNETKSDLLHQYTAAQQVPKRKTHYTLVSLETRSHRLVELKSTGLIPQPGNIYHLKLSEHPFAMSMPVMPRFPARSSPYAGTSDWWSNVTHDKEWRTRFLQRCTVRITGSWINMYALSAANNSCSEVATVASDLKTLVVIEHRAYQASPHSGMRWHPQRIKMRRAYSESGFLRRFVI